MKHSAKLLLITSAQNDLLAPTGKAWPMVRETVDRNQVPRKLAQLIAAARSSGVLVVHSPVVLDYDRMADFQPKSAIQQVIASNRLLAARDAGSDFIPEVSPTAQDVVLAPRQGFSSFWARTIQQTLEQVQPTTLYIAGMLAEGCVSSHARDAVENGYRPVVISDAIGSTSPELLAAAGAELALHTHALRTTEQVLSDWQR